VHVADGFAARNQDRFNLQDSEEIKDDRSYLIAMASKLANEGFRVNQVLLMGEPADQILGFADENGCDLIAMATHGHRFIGDLLWGSVAEKVRHRTSTPILLVRAPKK
jgi:nucleotide-binding universal stress UspA family protein